MNVDFDIEDIKEKVSKFTIKNDKIAAAIQLGVCIAGVVIVLFHELKSYEKLKKKKRH